MSIPLNWYEDFFHGVTLDLWRKAIPPKQTKAEAGFLKTSLDCGPGARVLDVPCGNGRLSFELAKQGLNVTGVDISEEFVTEAQTTLAERVDSPLSAGGSDPTADEVGTGSAEFKLGDMRRIEGKGIYDAAYCFGNSFGFLEYADMEKFLEGVARALKPGGRFVLETAMAAESVLPDFEEQTSHEIADIAVTIKERYDAAESCIDSEYVFERNGLSESRKAKHWIYTTAEIRRMFERAGFRVLELYGSLTREPYKFGSRELFLIAAKPSDRKS